MNSPIESFQVNIFEGAKIADASVESRNHKHLKQVRCKNYSTGIFNFSSVLYSFVKKCCRGAACNQRLLSLSFHS